MQPASRFSTVTADLIVPTFTRNVKVGQPPKAGLRVPQEAVMHVARFNILSGDRPKQVGGRRKGALTRGRSRPRSVEGGDGARRMANEAVIRAVRVDVLSCDPPPKVDALGYGALARACACGLDVEFGDGAVRSAHEAVKRAARVKVCSVDLPLQAEAACDWHNRGYGALRIE